MITRLLLVLALALTPIPPAHSQFFSNNMFARQHFAPPSTLTMVRATCQTDTANATTYTHAALTFAGIEPQWSVNVVVAIMGEDNATVFGVNSATFNGVAATEIIDEDGTGLVDAALYRLRMTGGNSVIVAPTYSEGLTGSSTVCGWVFAGPLASDAPDSSVQDDDTASGALVLTTGTTNAAGYTLGACISQDVSVTTTWAVITEREDTANAEASYSNADAAATGASMANTCDYSGTGDTSGVAGSFH